MGGVGICCGVCVGVRVGAEFGVGVGAGSDWWVGGWGWTGDGLLFVYINDFASQKMVLKKYILPHELSKSLTLSCDTF
jgi:hypothetical protein